jgi:prepilin-type N-terminal cleavage/methylation domain-containing protein
MCPYLISVAPKRHPHKTQGFTLVELMVVVAVIGILSAIAVPTFKKYTVKARQSEAKILLAAIHTAMLGFYNEYGVFGNCLGVMGYQHPTETYYGTFVFSIVGGAYINPNLTARNLGANCPDPVGGGAAQDVGMSWFPATKKASGCVRAAHTVYGAMDWAYADAVANDGPNDIHNSVGNYESGNLVEPIRYFVALSGNIINSANCALGNQANLGVDVWYTGHDWATHSVINKFQAAHHDHHN